MACQHSRVSRQAFALGQFGTSLKLWDISGHCSPRPKERNALHSTPLLRRRNCPRHCGILGTLADEAIIKSIAFFSRGDADANGAEEALGESAFPEGRILTVLHKRKERNPKAAGQKKVKAIKEKGSLICDV